MNPSLIIEVKKAKTGDKDAFLTLYTFYYKEMYKYAYYILKNKLDAEDVISETVIDAYTGIASLKKDESFKFWLFKILLAKIKRKQKQYVLNNQNINFDEVIEIGIDEDYSLSMEIKEALNKLNDEQRTIVLLSVISGYTGKEIAYILDKNHATVRSTLARSFKKLRDNLKGENL